MAIDQWKYTYPIAFAIEDDDNYSDDYSEDQSDSDSPNSPWKFISDERNKSRFTDMRKIDEESSSEDERYDPCCEVGSGGGAAMMMKRRQINPEKGRLGSGYRMW